VAVLFLSEEEKELIQQFIDTHRRLRHNTPSRSDEPQYTPDAPDVYIALAPDGIPALELAETDAGAGDTPGKSEEQLDIYRLTEQGTLQKVPNLSKFVYNLSQTEVAAGWIQVQRTKFGTWLAVIGGGLDLKLAKCTTNVNKGSSGTFKYYHGESLTALDPEQTDTVQALLGAYTANRWAYIGTINGSKHIINTECP
jgi:hypothetical protein